MEIAVAKSELLILAVAVPFGVNKRGSLTVPAPAQDPPEVGLVFTVILTWPDHKIGLVTFDFVKTAFGK